MPGGLPPAGKLFSNILTTVLVFLIIATIYSAIAGNGTKVETVSISKIAEDVNSGTVKSIVVSGGDITVQYTDGTTKDAKKEVESSLSQTLVNYGVSKDALAKVDLQVKDETGFMYWFVNLMPFIAPLILILFFFWILSRQAKGAGMQAFTFGQSKARIIDPDDAGQKVTFKDVAGAK